MSHITVHYGEPLEHPFGGEGLPYDESKAEFKERYKELVYSGAMWGGETGEWMEKLESICGNYKESRMTSIAKLCMNQDGREWWSYHFGDAHPEEVGWEKFQSVVCRERESRWAALQTLEDRLVQRAVDFLEKPGRSLGIKCRGCGRDDVLCVDTGALRWKNTGGSPFHITEECLLPSVTGPKKLVMCPKFVVVLDAAKVLKQSVGRADDRLGFLGGVEACNAGLCAACSKGDHQKNLDSRVMPVGKLDRKNVKFLAAVDAWRKQGGAERLQLKDTCSCVSMGKRGGRDANGGRSCTCERSVSESFAVRGEMPPRMPPDAGMGVGGHNRHVQAVTLSVRTASGQGNVLVWLVNTLLTNVVDFGHVSGKPCARGSKSLTVHDAELAHRFLAVECQQQGRVFDSTYYGDSSRVPSSNEKIVKCGACGRGPENRVGEFLDMVWLRGYNNAFHSNGCVQRCVSPCCDNLVPRLGCSVAESMLSDTAVAIRLLCQECHKQKNTETWGGASLHESRSVKNAESRESKRRKLTPELSGNILIRRKGRRGAPEADVVAMMETPRETVRGVGDLYQWDVSHLPFLGFSGRRQLPEVQEEQSPLPPQSFVHE
jgi:hypothetical protein